MMLPMLLVSLLILVLPDVFIFRAFLWGNLSIAWSMLFFAPNIVATVALVANVLGYSGGHTMRIYYTLFLCVAIPKLVFSLFSLLSFVIAHFSGCSAFWGNVLATLVGLITCVAFVFGYAYGWKSVVVKHQTVFFSELPKAFDGYRIVHLSDFHCGTFVGNEQVMQSMVDKVARLNPDLIVFTGDLVNTSPEELKSFNEILSSLSARDGVYSVMGNHDYCEYKNRSSVAEMKHDIDQLKLHEKLWGWTLLLNEHKIIQRDGDSLALIGVENAGEPPFKSYADLSTAMQGIPRGMFKILLSHDPTHWRREVLSATDIQLTLAGHTHGAQIMVGNFSPSSFRYREWGGFYKEGAQSLNVSLGIGGRFPFRLGAWPEIDLIVLRAIK